MKRGACAGGFSPPVAVSVIVLVAVACGCAAPSQRAQLRTAGDVYATTLNVLADYRRAGLIDAERGAEIEQWRVAARAGLDAWRQALDEGDSAVQSYNRAIGELTRALLMAEKGRRDDEGH